VLVSCRGLLAQMLVGHHRRRAVTPLPRHHHQRLPLRLLPPLRELRQRHERFLRGLRRRGQRPLQRLALHGEMSDLCNLHNTRV
jgi:hypothetical protein